VAWFRLWSFMRSPCQKCTHDNTEAHWVVCAAPMIKVFRYKMNMLGVEGVVFMRNRCY